MISTIILLAGLSGLSLADSNPTFEPLTARDTSSSVPKRCQFDKTHFADYTYIPFGDQNNPDICLGFGNGWGDAICDHSWDGVNEANFPHIKEALEAQVKKTGQWETSTVGSWTAHFANQTTKVTDQDLLSKVEALLEYGWKANGPVNGFDRALRYFISLRDDTIEIRRNQVSCPGKDRSFRVLPLGASITFGSSADPHTDKNGYRLRLAQDIVEGQAMAGNNELHYIGTQGPAQNDGTMDDKYDRWVEGFPGARIDQVYDNIIKDNILAQHPNVVTLLVGTNDMGQNHDVEGAPGRLGNFIDYILGKEPDATVLVASLPPNKKTDQNERTTTYNKNIRDEVIIRQDTGKHVLFVDISIITMADISSDGTHPLNEGYIKIGDAWYTALKRAVDYGWIKDPVHVSKRSEVSRGFWHW